MASFTTRSLLLVLAALILGSSPPPSTRADDDDARFKRLDENHDKHLSLKEFMAIGKHLRGHAKAHLKDMFDRLDKEGQGGETKDGRLSLLEFKTPPEKLDAKKAGDSRESVGDATVVHPVIGEVVDVDYMFKDTEVIVLGGNDSNFDYSYFAKVFDHVPNATEAPQNASGILGQLTAIDYPLSGGYYTGWVGSCRHHHIYSTIEGQAYENHLVVWEKKVESCNPTEYWNQVVIRIYGHTIYYFEE